MQDKNILKGEVQKYWNSGACGSGYTQQEKFSPAYFAEIEEYRYATEPQIFSFAQFTRYRNKKVLEVGVGAGTDFLQWVRAGAQAYGIDLTEEAVSHVRKRLEQNNLQAAEFKVGDAEHIPYPDNYFDLVYSWGVIHHSPDTERCIDELIRVCKPGGTVKFMVYNRHSLIALRRWFVDGLCKGKPYLSIAQILYHQMESVGTKAYTLREMHALLRKRSVELVSISAPYSPNDQIYVYSKWGRKLGRILAGLLGWNKTGWHLLVELRAHKNN